MILGWFGIDLFQSFVCIIIKNCQNVDRQSLMVGNFFLYSFYIFDNVQSVYQVWAFFGEHPPPTNQITI